MATAKTGSFYLTETIVLPALAGDNTRIQGSIDLGAYVSVAEGLAIAVETVDVIHQAGTDFGQAGEQFLAGNGALSTQLTDLNPGNNFVRADNQSLIASSALNIDVPNNIVSHAADLYPDNHGPAALSEAFLCVNSNLYCVAGNDGSGVGAKEVQITFRVKCRVVRLGKMDWMAIAIQSTASDN
jgi:hypothetical protein